MAPTPKPDRRTCGDLLRSLEQRIEDIDQKIDHVIWKLPDPYELPPYPPEPHWTSEPTDSYLSDD